MPSAVICGWHEVLPEVAVWSEEQIDRLSRLRSEFIKLCPAARDD
jgi:hypothetical protein